MTDRRFSEDDFAEILKKATELQSRALVRPEGSASGSVAGGLSLEEIKGVAAEVGIDPALVERAAGMVIQQRDVKVTADRYVLSDSAPGRLTEEDTVRLLQAVRDATAQQGSVELLGSGVEWSSEKGEPTRYNVSVHNLGGRNEVRVGVDRSVASVLTHFFPTAGGFLTGVAFGAALEPGVAGGVALMAGGLAAGFTAGRTLWHWSARKVRERAQEILNRVTEALPEPDSPSDQEKTHGE